MACPHPDAKGDVNNNPRESPRPLPATSTPTDTASAVTARTAAHQPLPGSYLDLYAPAAAATQGLSDPYAGTEVMPSYYYNHPRPRPARDSVIPSGVSYFTPTGGGNRPPRFGSTAARGDQTQGRQGRGVSPSVPAPARAPSDGGHGRLPGESSAGTVAAPAGGQVYSALARLVGEAESPAMAAKLGEVLSMVNTLPSGKTSDIPDYSQLTGGTPESHGARRDPYYGSPSPRAPRPLWLTKPPVAPSAGVAPGHGARVVEWMRTLHTQPFIHHQDAFGHELSRAPGYRSYESYGRLPLRRPVLERFECIKGTHGAAVADQVMRKRMEHGRCRITIPANFPSDVYHLSEPEDEPMVRMIARWIKLDQLGALVDDFAEVDIRLLADQAPMFPVRWIRQRWGGEYRDERRRTFPQTSNQPLHLRPGPRGYVITFKDVEYVRIPTRLRRRYYARIPRWMEVPEWEVLFPMPLVYRYAASHLVSSEGGTLARVLDKMAHTEWVCYYAATWLENIVAQNRMHQVPEEIFKKIRSLGVEAPIWPSGLIRHFECFDVTPELLEHFYRLHETFPWETVDTVPLPNSPYEPTRRLSKWVPMDPVSHSIDLSSYLFGVRLELGIPLRVLEYTAAQPLMGGWMARGWDYVTLGRLVEDCISYQTHGGRPLLPREETGLPVAVPRSARPPAATDASAGIATVEPVPADSAGPSSITRPRPSDRSLPSDMTAHASALEKRVEELQRAVSAGRERLAQSEAARVSAEAALATVKGEKETLRAELMAENTLLKRKHDDLFKSRLGYARDLAEQELALQSALCQVWDLHQQSNTICARAARAIMTVEDLRVRQADVEGSRPLPGNALARAFPGMAFLHGRGVPAASPSGAATAPAATSEETITAPLGAATAARPVANAPTPSARGASDAVASGGSAPADPMAVEAVKATTSVVPAPTAAGTATAVAVVEPATSKPTSAVATPTATGVTGVATAGGTEKESEGIKEATPKPTDATSPGGESVQVVEDPRSPARATRRLNVTSPVATVAAAVAAAGQRVARRRKRAQPSSPSASVGSPINKDRPTRRTRTRR